MYILKVFIKWMKQNKCHIWKSCGYKQNPFLCK